MPSQPAPLTTPSLDEVLASFRTPSVAAGEEIDWPEDPIPASSVQFHSMPLDIHPTPPSALEMLISSTRQNPIQTDVPVTPRTDRMEEWAGQAMGLNLRNSPEQVRRYLPLSVMWVANSKLKKVLDLLHQITSDVGVTDEQIQHLLHQLSTSLVAMGEVFQQVLPQQRGWMPWEVQISREAEGVRERVTFERQGDAGALRAEIEAKVREELRQEYEKRPLSLAARAELEQQIRNEVRQELEAKRQLQEQIAGPGIEETRDQLEARLRNEIEIQVRQDFLNQIAGSAGDFPSFTTPASAARHVTNFADQASAATGVAPGEAPKQVASLEPKSSVVLPTSTSTLLPAASTAPATSSGAALFAGEFSDEAADIFRLEAEEHLQTISMHVAALEKVPTNRDLIQGIRRATHTLKGAAGMMGFRAIADLCHVSEDLLESIMEGTTAISPAVLSIILDTAETLDLLINGRGNERETEVTRVQPLRVRYMELLGEQNTSLANVEESIDAELDTTEEDTSSVG